MLAIDSTFPRNTSLLPFELLGEAGHLNSLCSPFPPALGMSLDCWGHLLPAE